MITSAPARTNTEERIARCDSALATEIPMCLNGATCVPAYNDATGMHIFTCVCDAGFTGQFCTTVTSAAFESDSSYLSDSNTNGQITLDYSLALQTTLPDGILLYTGDLNQFFLLELFNGDLVLKYGNGTDPPLEINNFGQRINDGDYHTVTVVISNTNITLSVTINASTRTRRDATCADGVCQQVVTIPQNGQVTLDSLYIGGVSGNLVDKATARSSSGQLFTGCMQDIININTGMYIVPTTRAAPVGCTRVKRCDPDPCNSHGECTDLWLSFTCDCTIGYVGTTCNNSKFISTGIDPG